MIIKVIFLTLVTMLSGYNVDTDFPIVYSHHGSYFGYSVVLYCDLVNNTSWLIAGAPKGIHVGVTKEKSLYGKAPGVVYRCIINESCEEIKPERIDDEEGYIHQIEMKMIVKKEHAWFGSAISIQKLNGYLTVCAPRTIMDIFDPSTNLNVDTMQGMCYSGYVSSGTLLLEDRDLSLYDFSTPFWYNPLHGFSVHHSKIKDKKIGATEMHRIIGKPKHEVYGTVDIQHAKERVTVDLPITDELSQFGYSVTSGYFFAKEQLLYASGAPGWQYVGQVGIINPLSTPPIVAKLHGNEIGEFFGASLASGDLNNDGLDDILIGAPYWGNDNGKVYIYFGTSKGQFETSTSLQGTIDGGYFGYAIACGDLDADGFDDIIVGAPWEKQGVIYIYNGGGALKDKKLEASQRISVTETPHLYLYRIERFGFSISEPVDIDGNGYQDVAVGAYKSAHAIVLQSRPVIKTHISMEATPNILQRDAERFLIKICPKYDGYSMKSIQDFKITLIVDERYQRTKETYLDLKSINSTKLCVETNVTISDNVQDFIEPISISARHDFLYDNTSSNFCKTCPVENNYNKLKTAQLLLLFDIGCGEDKVCNSNISSTVTFYDIRDNNTWIIGSSDISLEVNLTNHGEPAYLTTLVFTLPEGIVLRSILPSCQEETSEESLIVVCDIGNPVAEGEERSVKLDLDMRHLTHDSLHGNILNFFMTVKTRSTNHGIQDITKTLNLISEVSLSLNGKATEESYYLSILNRETSNVTFQHTYQVYKLGASPIEDARLIVRIPTSRKKKSLIHIYKPRLYISGEVYDCLSESAILVDTKATEVQEEPSLDQFDLHVVTQKMQSISGRARTNEHNSLMNKNLTTIPEAQALYDMRHIQVLQTITESMLNSATVHTIYFNCSTPGVNCSTVVCDLSALKTLQDVGKLLIKFLLDVEELKDSLRTDKKILQFSTEARVEIIKPERRLSVNGTRSTMEIITLFHNTPKVQKIQLWIVLVSVSVGLLLLLIFTAVLGALGFFKRSGKQELTGSESSEARNEETKETIATSKTEDT